MKKIIIRKIPVVYLESKYDGDIEHWINQKTTDIMQAKNNMSVSGYTAIPVSYKKATDFYGYNVKHRVVKCQKIQLTEERTKELKWLIDQENKEYGLV